MINSIFTRNKEIHNSCNIRYIICRTNNHYHLIDSNVRYQRRLKLSTLGTRCLTVSELHFTALAKPFDNTCVSLDDTRRIVYPLVTLVVTHADAAVIVLPLTALICLIITHPRVKTQCRVYGADAIEEHGRR